MTTTIPEILQQFSRELQIEIQTRFDAMMDSFEDGTGDDTMPVLDEATVYLITQDMESSYFFDSFKDEVMEWWIAKGVYRYMTDEEYQNTTILGCRPKSDYFPKFKGRRVEFVKHL